MPADLNAVMPLITAERARALMVELARVPSPLTELFEAEPQLRAFIDNAVEPRLSEMGSAIFAATPWAICCATSARTKVRRAR